MIKCVIFDCDGTLVDSEYLCNLAFEILLKDYGVNETADLLLNSYRGAKLANILESLENKHKIEFEQGFVDKYREQVNELFESQLQVCEGVTQMLKELTLKHPTLRICVASSGPVDKITKALRITNIQSFFADHIFSSYDIQSWKPEPDIFLHASKQMDVSPDECIVIEDSKLGVQAAKSAGMQSVLYDPSGIHNSNYGAVKITKMSQLVKTIEQLSLNVTS